MNLALSLQHKVVTTLYKLFHAGTPAAAAPHSPARSRQTLPGITACPHTADLSIRVAPACAPAPRPMPLRVVRVVEAGQTRTHTGRLVISGRMADVCAELDRLAAREAAMG